MDLVDNVVQFLESRQSLSQDNFARNFRDLANNLPLSQNCEFDQEVASLARKKTKKISCVQSQNQKQRGQKKY